MRLLAFVDLHGDRKAYKELNKKIKEAKPDFIICCGDFTIFEHDVRSNLLELSRMDGTLFVVHGNHEEKSVVSELAAKHKNIEFIHQRIVEHDGMVLVGWGGGGFTIKDVEFEHWVKSVKKKLKQFKKEGKKIIFVTHAPIYKTNLDLLEGYHRGNKSFRHFITSFNVDFAFCGHFHENSGKKDRIWNCLCFNPGPNGTVVEY